MSYVMIASVLVCIVTNEIQLNEKAHIVLIMSNIINNPKDYKSL